MGNKKNKRGSITTTSQSSTTKTELIERTPDNDYGVLSDPDEGVEINIVNDISADQVPQSSENETHLQQQKQMSSPPTQPPTQPPTPPSSQQLSPPLSQLTSQQEQSTLSSQTLTLSGHLSQSLPPPSPGTKSLKALQLKLTTDNNFSKKMTLHTFFSYVVLAIEIERASSPSIARISIDNVEKLVDYLIVHHTANHDIETYLKTLFRMDVIRNLISAIVDFNTDQAGALDKLLSAEQMEFELMVLKDAASTSTSTAASASAHGNPAATSTTDPNPAQQTAQTSHSRPNRFLNFLKCIFCGCCMTSASPP